MGLLSDIAGGVLWRMMRPSSVVNSASAHVLLGDIRGGVRRRSFSIAPTHVLQGDNRGRVFRWWCSTARLMTVPSMASTHVSLSDIRGRVARRWYSTTRPYRRVLGIETSCDDTGAAVVDSDGAVLGDALASQTAISVETGGVMPFLAQKLHAQNIHGGYTR